MDDQNLKNYHKERGHRGGAHFLRQKKKVKKWKEGNEKWKKEEKEKKI